MFLFDTFEFRPKESLTVFGRKCVQKFHYIHMLNQIQLKNSFFNEIKKIEIPFLC